MHQIIRTLLPCAALALAACGTSETDDAPIEAELGADLRGSGIGGPFELTGEDGQTVRWDDFDGQYRIIYFGYTFCPDFCPTDVSRAMAGLKTFEQEHPERAAKVQPLFVGVDPERDTLQALREFTDQYHPRLIGMTGEPEVLQETAKAFAADFRKREPNEEGGYLVDHTVITYLFGPDGEALTTLATDQGPEAVARQLDSWVR
ncbi:SCO family protein [Qipengyuania sp. JC766]|uniref:SCO family protein n=1 Tax=Qipengyuania sp. JC766 TaxID=3232139 RepID=UPI00345AAA62